LNWWLWVVLGLVLVGVELITPGGFFFIFFGAAAIVLGILDRFHAAGPPSFQWLLFSVLSVLLLAVFRRPLMRRFHFSEGPTPPVDSLVGEACVVTEAPGADGVGKVELRGTSWTARVAGGAALVKGQRCRVERVDGLTLWIRAEGASS
jgi:membrane protein implicated in regulation of membrane protease activity